MVSGKNFVLVLLAVAFFSSPADAARTKTKLKQPPLPTADLVLVKKSDRQLMLLKGDEIIRFYRVALGKQPVGQKMRQGDGRTPEGAYFIEKRKTKSVFHRALQISYPNARDKYLAGLMGQSAGGLIMIHGLPNGVSAEYAGHPNEDWTEGCIAVTNNEIDEIFRMAPEGTPVLILP